MATNEAMIKTQLEQQKAKKGKNYRILIMCYIFIIFATFLFRYKLI